MDLDVLFLGTAGSTPTAARGLPSALVRRGGERLLFDCGEGTQRQLLRSTGLLDLEEVFVTHFHADHFLGLPGMLKTFALRGRERPLTVYGPPGLTQLFEVLKPVIGKNTYPIRLVELQPNDELERDGFQIFNPGSPTDRRRQPRHTMGLARVVGGRVAFEHVKLD